MIILHAAISEKRKLKKENLSLANFLRRLPAGELHIHKNGKYSRWRLVMTDPDTGVRFTSNIKKKDKDAVAMAHNLFIKQYIAEKIADNEEKIKLLEKVINCYSRSDEKKEAPDEFRNSLRTFLTPNFEAAQKWASMPYEKNMEHADYLKKKTKSGAIVRSKSEVMIANMLYDRGLPFRYEQAMQCRAAVIYPDFLIMDPVRKNRLVVWEHFGIMDNENYIRKNIGKLELLCQNGYVVHSNLIITFETSEVSLTEEMVTSKIDEFFSW